MVLQEGSSICSLKIKLVRNCLYRVRHLDNYSTYHDLSELANMLPSRTRGCCGKVHFLAFESVSIKRKVALSWPSYNRLQGRARQNVLYQTLLDELLGVVCNMRHMRVAREGEVWEFISRDFYLAAAGSGLRLRLKGDLPYVCTVGQWVRSPINYMRF